MSILPGRFRSLSKDPSSLLSFDDLHLSYGETVLVQGLVHSRDLVVAGGDHNHRTLVVPVPGSRFPERPWVKYCLRYQPVLEEPGGLQGGWRGVGWDRLHVRSGMRRVRSAVSRQRVGRLIVSSRCLSRSVGVHLY